MAVANGTACVGDFVRELPAAHIQPCACCLCGEGGRPPRRLMAVADYEGMPWVLLDNEESAAAVDVERIHAAA